VNDSELALQVTLRLRTVIDPETGVDVVRMRLVEDLLVDDEGVATYTFRPSSPLCPIAVTLALKVKEAVAMVPGIARQEIAVEGYIDAEGLSRLLMEA
jgi:metal-sulfur cluster biosynthetic enzyme